MTKHSLPLHLLSLEGLSRSDINMILDRADYFLAKYVRKNKIAHLLYGIVVANLFFEPSTRTRNSFQIAGDRLNAIVINPELGSSAVNKGESLLDTAKTISALGAKIIVIRHGDNHLPATLSQQLDGCTIINAGDGHHQHPTQGLIDLMTIRQHKTDWSSLQVSIIGDIAHSRVANSLIAGLTTMNIHKIHLVGPAALLPQNMEHKHVTLYRSMEDGIANSDVLVSLRLQKERMHPDYKLDINDFRAKYCLTQDRLQLAKKDAIVIHPGPMNRDVEIASDVADGKQSYILQQAENGIAIRMAVLELFGLRKGT